MIRFDDGLDDVLLPVHDGDDERVMARAVLVRQRGAVPDEEHGEVLVAVDCRQVERGCIRLQSKYVQSWAKERARGCVNTPPAAGGR